jgi:protoporphyrinogen oxidase
MLSYAYARAFPIEHPHSFHDWVRNQFGERLFSIFFKTYTEKVWGLACDEISADWAAQRIKGLDLGVAVINALRRALNVRPAARKPGVSIVKTLIEGFEYPRKGPGMMWEAAARKIRQRGGKVLMGRELASLAFDPHRKIRSVEVSTIEGARESFTANHIISSAPIPELMQKITPRPISYLHARELRYRDFMTVALMVDKPSLFPDNWIYIHDPAVTRTRNTTRLECRASSKH